MIAENIQFQELNGDQSREYVNTQQRYRTFLEASSRKEGYRGSVIFVERNAAEYLIRDYYDPISGVKRQKSLGRKSEATEKLLQDFITGKAEATERKNTATEVLARQAAINRALGLGRVPEIGARIIRSIDKAGLLGHGLKVVGTNALYAYEAAAGIHFSSDITTTEDIDILFDTRAHLRFVLEEDVGERTLISLLKRVDRSFIRTANTFQAANAGGYLVDLIRPLRNPPWQDEAVSISGHATDLEATQTPGLIWQENAQPFEAIAIDSKGFPLRIIAPDPRAFAVHKLWMSAQPDRNPLKRKRDRMQAQSVAALVARYLLHLPFNPALLKNFPKDIVAAAGELFEIAKDRHDPDL